MALESLFCCNIAELVSCMIKKYEETCDYLFWCYFEVLLQQIIKGFLSCSLIICMLYRSKVTAFWIHDPEAGPPLEKHFLPKPLHMQSLLVSKSCLIQKSFGCAFCIFQSS